MLKHDGLFEKLDTKICIGQGYRGKTGKLGVGACTCKFEHNVNGCPPTENQIYDFLKQYISDMRSDKKQSLTANLTEIVKQLFGIAPRKWIVNIRLNIKTGSEEPVFIFINGGTV